MDLNLDETQESIAATFRDLLTKECPVDVVRASAETGFAEPLWQRYVELGAPSMGAAEAGGGLGLGLLELGLVALESGRALAPVPFVEVAVAARLLADVAAEAKPTSAVLEGETILSIAPSRAGAIAGTAGADPARTLVPFGAVADGIVALDGERLVVRTRDAGDVGPRAIDLAEGGHAFWPTTGGEGLAEGGAVADRFRRAEDEWRLLTAFWLVGLAHEAVGIGARYAQERIQFGRPIGAFQAIAHPLADCATRVHGAELLAMEAAWAFDEEPERFPMLCAMAFAWAAQAAQRASGVSLHTHGGYGFSTENDIQLYYRRAFAIPALGGGAREALQTVGVLAVEDVGRRVEGVAGGAAEEA